MAGVDAVQEVSVSVGERAVFDASRRWAHDLGWVPARGDHEDSCRFRLTRFDLFGGTPYVEVICRPGPAGCTVDFRVSMWITARLVDSESRRRRYESNASAIATAFATGVCHTLVVAGAQVRPSWMAKDAHDMRRLSLLARASEPVAWSLVGVAIAVGIGVGFATGNPAWGGAAVCWLMVLYMVAVTVRHRTVGWSDNVLPASGFSSMIMLGLICALIAHAG